LLCSANINDSSSSSHDSSKLFSHDLRPSVTNLSARCRQANGPRSVESKEVLPRILRVPSSVGLSDLSRRTSQISRQVLLNVWSIKDAWHFCTEIPSSHIVMMSHGNHKYIQDTSHVTCIDSPTPGVRPASRLHNLRPMSRSSILSDHNCFPYQHYFVIPYNAIHTSVMSTEADLTTGATGSSTLVPENSSVAARSPESPKDDTPLGKLSARLGEIISRAEHSEMYGVELKATSTG